MLRIAWVCIALGCCGSSSAVAWDDYGHRLVAAAAYAGLEDEVRAKVDALLGGGIAAFARAGVWADHIKAKRPQTRSWHFAAVPFHADGFDEQRDCSQQNCIVAKLEQFAGVLRSDAPAAQKGEALRFVINLVADIHQPLNCANDDNDAARDVPLLWRKRRMNLRDLWDHYVLANALNQVSEAVADGGIADWCNESHDLARSVVYVGLPDAGGQVSEDYMRVARHSAMEQLAKAAARLAKLLNDALR